MSDFEHHFRNFVGKSKQKTEVVVLARHALAS